MVEAEIALRFLPDTPQVQELRQGLAASMERVGGLIEHIKPGIRVFSQRIDGRLDEHGNASIEIDLP
jgi:hypothetical protein